MFNFSRLLSLMTSTKHYWSEGKMHYFGVCRPGIYSCRLHDIVWLEHYL